MTQRGSGLAARFRRAVQSEEEARRQAEDDRRKRLESARTARVQLFQELAAFAEETGFLKAQISGTGVTLRYRERFVHFAARGDADAVAVEIEGAPDEEHSLYREAALDDKWVWVCKRRGREDRQPLFDKGLEELLVRGLGLPRPSDEADPGGKKSL